MIFNTEPEAQEFFDNCFGKGKFTVYECGCCGGWSAEEAEIDQGEMLPAPCDQSHVLSGFARVCVVCLDTANKAEMPS